MNIFLSYVREDIQSAQRLYSDVSAAGYHVWFDKESLLAGQLWERAALKAIDDCHCFLALLSSRSVSRKGFVNREIRRALELWEEQPEDTSFLIPVRLDDCTPSHRQLALLHRVDMFPSWDDGLRQILKAMRMGQPADHSRLDRSRSDLIEQTLSDGDTRAILGLLAIRTRPFTEDEPDHQPSSLPVDLEYDEVVEGLHNGTVSMSTDSVYPTLNRLVASGLLRAQDTGGDGQEEPRRVWVALCKDLRAALRSAPR